MFGPEPLPVRRMLIFDRWGDLVYESRDFFSNQPESGWDGTFRYKKVLPGVYVFLIEIELTPGRTEVLRGDVTVLR
ncbi:MAG: gliding motility-associated C-terminal domain-containing protein [Saprospirales bacterium]|nr:gliding motility-associated C-terminal domain-containing protein [Saprospirales bacterium]MBK8919906.1 gliding motility-associated C-terminal domain-containing protein [Saprospirales bacterium]